MATHRELDRLIQDRISSFVGDINMLVRAAALEAVHEALGGEGPARRTGATGRPVGRPPGRRGARRGNRGRRGRGGKRVRRSGAEVEALAGQLQQAVKSNPGSRLGDLAAVLGVDTKDARRPMTTLINEKMVRSEGVRGGTRYYPAGGGGRRKATGRKKPAKKKTTKRKKTAKG
jgi:hypothetical protein